MKGPFERLKYDLRRLWECPICKRRERSDGTVTSRFCVCPGKEGREGQRTAMKLLEEAGHRTVPEFKYQPPVESFPDESPFVEPATAPENISITPEPTPNGEIPAETPDA